MSVLLITKSYTFLVYSHCYLLQNIYGMCEKNIFTLSTALTFLLDRSFPDQKFCPNKVQLSPLRSPANWHLHCTHMCQLSSSAEHQGCPEASEQVGAARDSHPFPWNPVSWAEVEGAENLAKGHQLMGLPLLEPPGSPQHLSPSTAAPATALQPQQHFV